MARRRRNAGPATKLRTEGFILLQRWHTVIGDRLEKLEANFYRTCKTQYTPHPKP